ncbi:hypothetical protein O1L60_15085 [Streptomyces diastatochromogenes]|nr:hypothetical protein [Streptomyces diastatochromogenes]
MPEGAGGPRRRSAAVFGRVVKRPTDGRVSWWIRAGSAPSSSRTSATSVTRPGGPARYTSCAGHCPQARRAWRSRSVARSLRCRGAAVM